MWVRFIPDDKDNVGRNLVWCLWYFFSIKMEVNIYECMDIIHSTSSLYKMFLSLDLLLSEKWSWFPTSSQALHLLLKPDDCSVLVIWSSKTQSMNNYLFLLFCGSVTRDNSSRDFHPLRYSFADVVQADDDVGLCQHFYVEFFVVWKYLT